DEVDDAGRHVGRVARHLEAELLVGEQRGEVLEPGPHARLVGRHAADRVDTQQGGVLLVVAGGTAGALDVVALAQGEAAHLADRDVDVAPARQVAVGAQEAESLVAQIEQAGHRDGLALVLLLLPAALQVATATASSTATTAALTVAAAPAPVAAVARLGAEVLLALVLGLVLLLRRRRGRHVSGLDLDLGVLDFGSRLDDGFDFGSVLGVVAVGLWSGAGGPLLRGRVAVVVAGRRRAGRRHAGGLEDLVDQVGLLGAAARLEAHRVGDGMEFVALLAFQYRAFELCLRAHAEPRLLRVVVGLTGMAAIAWLTTSSMTRERVASRLYDGTTGTSCSSARDFTYFCNLRMFSKKSR